MENFKLEAGKISVDVDLRSLITSSSECGAQPLEQVCTSFGLFELNRY